MKHLPLSLLFLLSIPSMLTRAQETTESESLLQAVVLVLKDDGVHNAIARKHPNVMEGCAQYGALRMDLIRNDKRSKNDLHALDSCLFGAAPDVLFFENIHEVITHNCYNTKRSAYILKFSVAGPPNAPAHTSITSKVKRDKAGMHVEKVNIKRKQWVINSLEGERLKYNKAALQMLRSA